MVAWQTSQPNPVALHISFHEALMGRKLCSFQIPVQQVVMVCAIVPNVQSSAPFWHYTPGGGVLMTEASAQ